MATTLAVVVVPLDEPVKPHRHFPSSVDTQIAQSSHQSAPEHQRQDAQGRKPREPMIGQCANPEGRSNVSTRQTHIDLANQPAE
jgi:hypothetical protein